MTARMRLTDHAIWFSGTDAEVAEAIRALRTVPIVRWVAFLPEHGAEPGSPAEAYVVVTP